MGILAWSKVLPPTVKRDVSLTELTPTESPSGGLVPTFGDPRWSLLAEAGPGHCRSGSPGGPSALATTSAALPAKRVKLGTPPHLYSGLRPGQERGGDELRLVLVTQIVPAIIWHNGFEEITFLAAIDNALTFRGTPGWATPR